MNRTHLKRRLRSAIEQASASRIIFLFVLVLYLIARQFVYKINFLYPWLFLGRRQSDAHYVGDRRSTWLERLEQRLGIEIPSSTRDLRVNIVVIVATIQVTIIILATATSRPENILLIPTFCLYAAAMLAYRQYRINNMAV